jgi:hypothetical protein
LPFGVFCLFCAIVPFCYKLPLACFSGCFGVFFFSFWWRCGRVGGGGGGELKNGTQGALVPLSSPRKNLQLRIFLICERKLDETLDNYFIDVIIYR